MRPTRIPYLLVFALFSLMNAVALSSAVAADAGLSTSADAEAFFREYFEHYDKGKVPPRDPSLVKEVGKEAFKYICDALKHQKYRLVAIRTLSHVRTAEDVLSPLYPFLKDRDENVRAETAVALGSQGRPEATERLIPLLKDPVDSVVRVAVNAIGACGGKNAAGPLLDLYKNGETHDAWGYHIKNEILLALRQLQAKEALPLCYEQLTHENLTIFESSIRLVAFLAKDEEDRIAAGKELLSYARKNNDPNKVYDLVWGLGQITCAAAVPYICAVYRERQIPRHLTGDYVVADALANIAKPNCAPMLMEIYLTTSPLREMTCLDGEPIEPCLRGLKAISGRDFGDDREKWKEWYDLFSQQEKIGNAAAQKDTPSDADKR